MDSPPTPRCDSSGRATPTSNASRPPAGTRSSTSAAAIASTYLVVATWTPSCRSKTCSTWIGGRRSSFSPRGSGASRPTVCPTSTTPRATRGRSSAASRSGSSEIRSRRSEPLLLEVHALRHAREEVLVERQVVDRLDLDQVAAAVEDLALDADTDLRLLSEFRDVAREVTDFNLAVARRLGLPNDELAAHGVRDVTGGRP